MYNFDDIRNYDLWATGIILVSLSIWIVKYDMIQSVMVNDPIDKLQKFHKTYTSLCKLEASLTNPKVHARITSEILQNLTQSLWTFFSNFTFDLFHRGDPITRYIRIKPTDTGASTGGGEGGSSPMQS